MLTELGDLVNILKNEETRTHFREFLVEVSDTDRQFLLAAMVSMATSRRRKGDREFINHIAQELLTVGFVDPNTTDLCIRDAKDLLVDLCLHHSFAMTFMVSEIDGMDPASVAVKVNYILSP